MITHRNRGGGWALAIMAAALVVASCGSAPLRSEVAGPPTSLAGTAGSGTPSPAGARCAGDYAIHQSMNGELSTCLRVGALGPGAYHVVLDQVLTARGRAAGPASPAGAGPAVHLSLSPASGRPGQAVTVTGTFGSVPARHVDHAGLCWDGCRDGLQYSGVALHWLSPTVFQASLVVPAAPWVERNPDRVDRLSSGIYPIEVQCLGAIKGCGLGPSEGSTGFHLDVPAGFERGACPSQDSCAGMAASPGVVRPGQMVEVTGFAPLVSVIGSDQPFAFQLEVLNGPPRGPQVRFASAATGSVVVNLYLGHALLEVKRPPSLASLGAVTPGYESSDGLAPISANPAEPDRVAWCAPGSVMLTNTAGPGGVERIPTASVHSALAGTGLRLGTSAAPGCDDVALPPSGNTVFAGFEVNPNGQAPPFAEVPLYTTDMGASWHPVPAPAGAAPDSFGGFRYRADRVEALYTAEARPGSPAAQPPLVEIEANGRWAPAAWSCPPAGPCVTFGAYTWGNCAMDGTNQQILYSHDGAATWAEPQWPTVVRACAPAQLVALSGTSELLVQSESPYTLLLSTDGGASWEDIGLPALPGALPGGGFGPTPAGVVMLPDGSLLDAAQTPWQLLQPQAAQWCPVTGGHGSDPAGGMTVIGNQVWWLHQTGVSAPAAEHARVASLTC